MSDKNDVFGKALWEYHLSPGNQELITWTSLTDKDPVPLSYFLETMNRCPFWSKKLWRLPMEKFWMLVVEPDATVFFYKTIKA